METGGKTEKRPSSAAASSGHKKEKKRKSNKAVKSASSVAKVDTQKAVMPQKTSNRDYNSQLVEYLDGWMNKDTNNSAWKFNKKLQTWALLNIYSLDDYTFLKLMPYILSIEGNSKDRLLETVIETIKDETLNKDEMKVTRAKQIKKLLVS